MRISKRLSANDIGATGGHQAGIHVPKQAEILSFLPTLPRSQKNPRLTLTVREMESGELWEFQYIYYNNRHFDVGGTRNEYRLTGMTSFLRSVAAGVGDELEFTKDEDGSLHMRLIRKAQTDGEENIDVLVLRSGWIIINR